jgi:hypothetical protein
MGCELAVLVVVRAEVVEEGDEVEVLLLLELFNVSIQHLEQQPPVASAPKKPQPLLHRMGWGGCCSLLALMVMILIIMIRQPSGGRVS